MKLSNGRRGETDKATVIELAPGTNLLTLLLAADQPGSYPDNAAELEDAVGDDSKCAEWVARFEEES